jgi:hypothetical protein
VLAEGFQTGGEFGYVDVGDLPEQHLGEFDLAAANAAAT